MKALLGFRLVGLLPVLSANGHKHRVSFDNGLHHGVPARSSSSSTAPRNLALTVNGPDVTLTWQSPEPGSSNAEKEPNNRLDERQHLFAPSPVQIDGSVQKSDEGQLSVTFVDDTVDDFEDLFDFTIAAGGGTVALTGLSEDTDLYLLSEASGQLEIVGESFNVGPADELITLADSLEGEFIIAVSIFDPGPDGQETDYRLTVSGGLGGEAITAYRVYRATSPDAISSGAMIGEVDGTVLTAEDSPTETNTYYYQVTAVSVLGESTPSNEVSSPVTTGVQQEAPRAHGLAEAWPNPFSSATQFAFDLPEPGAVRLEVFDLLGRRVALLADGFRGAGRYQEEWRPERLENGVYLYVITHSENREAGSVVLLR